MLKVEDNSELIQFSKKLKLDFNLNQDQEQTINAISAFLTSNLETLTVSGSAGCGKTTIIGIVVSYLIEKPYNFVLCAPTHKAKDILKRSTKFSVITIHKLLSLKPNVEIEKFNAKDLKFVDKNKDGIDHIPYKGVIIIDESSMINDELYDLILKRAKEYKSKVIFIGDSAQLQPVKQNEKSKVFHSADYISNLEIIERQKKDNPLTELLAELRLNAQYKFVTNDTDKGGLSVTKDPLNFFKSFYKDLNLKDLETNPYSTRILAFTNDRVKKFNTIIREKLFKYTDEYVVGELLMAYDNYTIDKEIFMVNSCDYIVIDVKETEVRLPGFVNLPGFTLTLKPLSDDEVDQFEIDIISKKLPSYVYGTLAVTLDNLRETALLQKTKIAANMCWRKFYALNQAINSPVELIIGPRLIKKKCLDYGYCHTVHKS